MKLGFLRQVMWGGWKKFGEKNGWSRYPQRIHLGSNHNGKHFKTSRATIWLNSKEISKNMAKFNLCSVGVDLRGSKWLVCGWGLKMWRYGPQKYQGHQLCFREPADLSKRNRLHSKTLNTSTSRGIRGESPTMSDKDVSKSRDINCKSSRKAGPVSIPSLATVQKGIASRVIYWIPYQIS